MNNEISNGKTRWIVLGTGTLLLLFLGLIYGWSIFRAPLTELFPEWSTSQLSLTFTISMICFCLGGFFSGQMQKKMNHKVLLAAAAVVLFAGFFGVSMLDVTDPSSSLIRLYVLYGVCGGFGVGIGYNCVISTVNKWFPDKAGLASGIMLMGFGLGGIVLGSVVNILISSLGLFVTFKVLAVSISVILIIGVVLLKKPEGNAVVMSGNDDGDAYDLTPTQMMKKASFWLFFVWCILLNSAGLLVINNAATIAVAFGAPAVLGLIVSVCNGVGRTLIGGIFDQSGRKISMLINIIFTCTAGILLLLGDVMTKVGIIIMGLLFTGLGYGATPTLGSAFIHREFGTKYYPVNFSICNFCLIPASFTGPMVSSYLIERAGGAYTPTFVMIIVLALLAAVLWGFVNRYAERG